jgi:hypothetical protein
VLFSNICSLILSIYSGYVDRHALLLNEMHEHIEDSNSSIHSFLDAFVYDDDFLFATDEQIFVSLFLIIED